MAVPGPRALAPPAPPPVVLSLKPWPLSRQATTVLTSRVASSTTSSPLSQTSHNILPSQLSIIQSYFSIKTVAFNSVQAAKSSLVF